MQLRFFTENMPNIPASLEKPEQYGSIPSKNKSQIFLVGGFLLVFIVTIFLGVLYSREAEKQTRGEQTDYQTFLSLEGFQKIGKQGSSEQVGNTEEANFSFNQESIIAKSTGVVKEIVSSEDNLANSPIKIDTLKISFNDGTGKQSLLL